MKLSSLFKTMTEATLVMTAVAAMATSVHAQGRRGGGGRGPMPAPGMRAERKILNYAGQQFRGQNTLFLKRALKNQFPGINLRNKKLGKVIVMAKSEHGRGQAFLVVGQQSSYSQQIPGNPYNFQDYAPYTYTRMQFPVQGASQGKWQIKLQGNIKIQNVIVQFKGQNNNIKLYVDQHLRGQNVLPLKRMLRQQNPQAFNKLDSLKKITIVAKSKHGQGTATLKMGRDISRAKYIDGTPSDFHTPAAYTFSKVSFQGPAYSTSGVLQILLKGNIKVKEVIFEFYPSNGGGWH